MKVALELIQPSPNPVRTTWDEDKMNELAQSIKEQGVIVPVKVRPVNGLKPCRKHGFRAITFEGDLDEINDCMTCSDITEIVYGESLDYDNLVAECIPFELVYGHRRVEAARRAGLDEIETIIETANDDEAQWQALIENIQRDDMTSLEIARGCLERKHAGYSDEQIATRLGWKNASTVRLYLSMAQAPAPVLEVLERIPRNLSQHKFNATGSLRDAPELRASVLEKAAKEGLSAEQILPVAQAIAAAPSPEAKKKLIDWEYSPVIHDPDNIRERAKEYGAHDALYHDDTPTKQAQWEQTPEIKAVVNGVLEAAKMWTRLIKQTRSMAEIGKMAPESRQFIAHRARTLAKTLTDWANELEARSDD